MTDITTEIEKPEEENEQSFPDDNFDDNQNASGDQQDRNRTRFAQGEMLRFVKVRFPGNSRAFAFMIGNRYFAYGQKVVAMSDRGMAVGYINSFPYEVAFQEHMLPVRSIAKVATDDDLKEERENYAKERQAERACIKYIDRYRLDMTLTHVQFIQFGKKAVFYFNAPTRVDFRDLVKDLVGELRMRIELRQISVRDRTAALGGLGACGLQTCCSSFLTQYGQVSIKMAKNQNLALVPSKINGVCGQLKCCIKYEDDVYSHKRTLLPRDNSVIRALNGDLGRVTKIHVLEEQFEMITSEGKIRLYSKEMFDPKAPAEKAENFPRQFEHVVNEKSTLITPPPAAVVARVESEETNRETENDDRDNSEKSMQPAEQQDDHNVQMQGDGEDDNHDAANDEQDDRQAKPVVAAVSSAASSKPAPTTPRPQQQDQRRATAPQQGQNQRPQTPGPGPNRNNNQDSGNRGGQNHHRRHRSKNNKGNQGGGRQ
jgi:cell fate regulator YaaT (PSP1 superfamily)